MRENFSAPGRVEWIGIRPQRHQTVESLEQVLAVEGHGLDGDHAAERLGGKRQVTLLQSEHLRVIGQLAKRMPEPGMLRRNLLVSGINLRALTGQTFRIGEALFEGTGDCPPCRNMEAALGHGGFNAMVGMGGLTARVLEGGRIRLGDLVEPYNQRVTEPHLI